ncbi:MAG TPA: putative Ig domain-containing protein [Longimicrobium sp.]|nr:putative Ig domain-containing protein [Longimicrobium sp.]
MNRTAFRPLRRAALVLAAAGLTAWASTPGVVPGETRTGWLNVVWQTRGVENELAHVGLFLVDEEGAAIELRATDADLAPHGGLLRLNGRRLTVTGDLSPVREPRGTPTLRVRAITPRGGARAALSAVVDGSRSYVTLVCRFPDHGIEPSGTATLRRWMGDAYPGLDHFWRENSENRVSIDAAFAGPFLMPLPSTSYNTNGSANLAMLFNDCTRAADPEVDFSQYAGVNMQFNSTLWGYSWGGSWSATLDGQARRWAATWMASWATQSTYAHETGHSLGLPHSSGPYTAVYDSKWDVMSGGGSTDATVGTRVATHTIAYHKDLMGWIPASRKYVARPGTSATIDLARDALPGAAGYQLAQVPVGTSGTFLTLEARRYAGYDAQGRLPGEAVILHLVNPVGSGPPARVVDVDGNGNVNDAGAMWVPGETFASVEMGVSIRVLSATADGFRVEVSTTGTLAIATDSVLPAGTMGADYGGAAFAADGAPAGVTWSVASGALPGGLTLTPTGQLVGVPAQAGVFRFGVRVTAGNGFGIKEMRLEIAKPQVAQTAVLDALLGGATLPPDQQRFLDLLGNQNGRLDVGDVRAWMIDQGHPVGS